MAKISHFLVTYNHDTGEWDTDEEKLLACLDGESAVYDEETYTWLSVSEAGKLEDESGCAVTLQIMLDSRE